MNRIIRKIGIVLILISTITITGISQKRNTSEPFFIIQVTDPQFGMYESDKGFSKETELYEKAVDAINKLNPEFVVITGDLVNNKEERPQVAEFKRITDKINSEIHVYFSPGNHDIGLPPAQKDIDSFISDYGHDRFSFKHKKSLFIGINTCIIKAGEPVPEKVQYDWLKKELSIGKKAKQVIIFSHYPFFIKSADEPETYSNISIETRDRYLSLFKKSGVDAVFSGHLHNNAEAQYDEIQFITTSAVGKPLGKTESGIRVIKVYSDHIISVFYTLNEIPDKISM